MCFYLNLITCMTESNKIIILIELIKISICRGLNFTYLLTKSNPARKSGFIIYKHNAQYQKFLYYLYKLVISIRERLIYTLLLLPADIVEMGTKNKAPSSIFISSPSSS